MEDLCESVTGEGNENVDQKIPTIVQYGVKIPFRVAVVGSNRQWENSFNYEVVVRRKDTILEVR